MNRPPMTAAGAERLREELVRLKNEERPKIIEAIAQARAHGDLRENAEYHAAKEEQGFVEGRIADVEDVLSRAQIIEPAKVNAGGRVVFGAHVELLNVDTDETLSYQIVGEMEADIKLGLISVTSPVGRALIGSEEGDTVAVDAPSGTTEFEIVSVAYR